ncbi:MAG: DUF4157 domain-containing protein [Terracidiphilus sp.]
MPSLHAPAFRRSAKAPARTAAPPPVLASASPAQARHQLSPVLPAQPAAIATHAGEGAHEALPFSQLPLQPKLAIGSVNDPLEAEADRMTAQVLGSGPGMGMGIGAQAAAPALHRRAAGDGGGISEQSGPPAEAPASVQDALGSPGKPLDSATRAYMEPRFGADLAGVRVHTGADSAAAARSVNAHAYTVGKDIFFGAGQYNPQSGEGRRLLAHELSHTVQQSGGSAGKRLSSATPGVYRDPIPNKTAPQGTAADTETKTPKTEQVTVPVPLPLLQHLQLIPPSLLAPTQQPPIFSPGNYALGHPGASLFQPPSQYSPTSPSILPPAAQYTPFTPSPLAPASPLSPLPAPAGGGAGAATPAAAPKAPDRVSLHDFGSLSIGARFGFPDLSKDTKPGDPPTALQESLMKAQVMNFVLTGQPPSAYAVDPGKLVGALWGIFSTQIAPDVARKIAAGLASKPAGSGPSYQLDATILLNIGSGSGPTATKTGGGAGATLTVLF